MPSRISPYVQFWILATGIAFATLGCSGTGGMNDAFAITPDLAEAELDDMRRAPRPLARPVLVLGGYGDPGWFAGVLADAIRARTTTPERVASSAFFFEGSFESAREKAIDVAAEAFAQGDRDRLAQVELDLIGISMGGLVARYTALTEPDSPGLNVARIFTISSPHRGAEAAEFWSLDDKVIQMRAGSPVIARLDEALAERPFELYAYVRLGDGIVGETNAAPPGHPLLWVPNLAMSFAHLDAPTDPRILADILRRLRDEPAYADADGSPLPFDTR